MPRVAQAESRRLLRLLLVRLGEVSADPTGWLLQRRLTQLRSVARPDLKSLLKGIRFVASKSYGITGLA